MAEYNRSLIDQFRKLLSTVKGSSDPEIISFFSKIFLSDSLSSELIATTVTALVTTPSDMQSRILIISDIISLLRENYQIRLPIVDFLKETLFKSTPSAANPRSILTSLGFTLNQLLKKRLISTQNYQEILLLTITHDSSTEMITSVTTALREIIEMHSFEMFSDVILALKLTMANRLDIPPVYSDFLQDYQRASIKSNREQMGIMTFDSAIESISTLYGCSSIPDDNNTFDYPLYLETNALFNEWISLNCSGVDNNTEIQSFLKKVEHTMLYATPSDLRIKFFTYLIDICVDQALTSDNQNKESHALQSDLNTINYAFIDGFSKLICILLKQSIASQTEKCTLYRDILSCICIVLTKNHETQLDKFNQRPFFRIFFNLIYDIQRAEYAFTPVEIADNYTMLAQLLHNVSPTKYPAFAITWLEILSHKLFMPVLLENEHSQDIFRDLLLDLMNFLSSITSDSSRLQDTFVETYYRAIIRVMLVILHDWPNFFVKYSTELCEVIPDEFVQLKNIVLATFPKSIKPPEPYTSSEDILESNPDFKQQPYYNSSIYSHRAAEMHLAELFQTFSSNESNQIIGMVLQKLVHSPNEYTPLARSLIDKKSINALIIFLPTSISSKFASTDTKAYAQTVLAYSFLLKLLKSSQPVVREGIIESIANQIRFPNSITKFYIKFLMNCFQQQEDNQLLDVQEDITCMLVNRLYAHKPHPWGIIFSLIELIKASNGIRSLIAKNTELMQIFQYVLTGGGGGGRTQ